MIDKPAGMTSHDVVGRLRRITGEKSIGHLGTLDPMATGVLPLLLGKFTRLAQYFSSAEKSYTGHDSLRLCHRHLRRRGRAAAPTLAGTRLRVDAGTGARRRQPAFTARCSRCRPPYSAKKIAGTPAYKLAREGKPVELKAARVDHRHFEIIALDGAEASFHHEHQRRRLCALGGA